MADVYLHPTLEYLKSDPEVCAQQLEQKVARLERIKRICLIATIIVVGGFTIAFYAASLGLIAPIPLLVQYVIVPLIANSSLIAYLILKLRLQCGPLRDEASVARRIITEYPPSPDSEHPDQFRFYYPLPEGMQWDDTQKSLKQRYYHCLQWLYSREDGLQVKIERLPRHNQEDFIRAFANNPLYYQQLLNLLHHKMTCMTFYLLLQGRPLTSAYPEGVELIPLDFNNWREANYPFAASQDGPSAAGDSLPSSNPRIQGIFDEELFNQPDHNSHWVNIMFGRSQSPFCKCRNGQVISIQDMLRPNPAELAQRIS